MSNFSVDNEERRSAPTLKQRKYLHSLCERLKEDGVNPWEGCPRRPESRAEFAVAIELMKAKCKEYGIPVKETRTNFENIYGGK